MDDLKIGGEAARGDLTTQVGTTPGDQDPPDKDTSTPMYADGSMYAWRRVVQQVAGDMEQRGDFWSQLMPPWSDRNLALRLPPAHLRPVMPLVRWENRQAENSSMR